MILIACSTYAMKECQSKTTSDEIPCTILLPNNITDTDCTDINISIYRNETLLYKLSMSNYTLYFCNVTFNQTEPGIYPILYSTGNTGSISVTRGNNMIYLLYFATAIILLLFFVGFYNKDYTSLSIGSMLLMIMGIFLHINGYNGIYNIIVETMALIFILFGAYVFLRSIFEFSDINTL